MSFLFMDKNFFEQQSTSYILLIYQYFFPFYTVNGILSTTLLDPTKSSFYLQQRNPTLIPLYPVWRPFSTVKSVQIVLFQNSPTLHPSNPLSTLHNLSPSFTNLTLVCNPRLVSVTQVIVSLYLVHDDTVMSNLLSYSDTPKERTSETQIVFQTVFQ